VRYASLTHPTGLTRLVSLPSIAKFYECFLLIMGQQNHRKAIQSLEKKIVEHQEKIRLELLKENPDLGLIRHWEKEISAFQKGISQALKRLGRK